jgi:hypothetical protein
VVHLQRTTFLLVISGTIFFVIAAGSHVAGVTVVSVSMAEPECHGAAEAALKVDVLIAMFFAFLDTRSDRLSRAPRAHKFFGLEVLNSVSRVTTVDHTSEVRVLAFVALVVRHLE